jgi:hypothetical protein
MKTAIIISCILLNIFALNSCKRKPQPFVITPIEYVKDIYIAGTATENGTNQACYWKNGNKVVLATSNDQCVATDITVTAGGDVYVCGFVGFKPQVFYWKNGIQYPVTELNEDCVGSCIAINGDSVYIGGGVFDGVTEFYSPYIWARKIGGIGNDIKMASSYGYINDIEFYKNNLYAIGRIWDANIKVFKAAYFNNGFLSLLSNQRSSAEDLFIDNGTVYICGEVSTNSKTDAVFWKDGAQTNLTTGENTSAFCLDVFEKVVYSGGRTLNNNSYSPIYWFNTTKNIFNNSAQNGTTVDIDIISGDNYALTSPNVTLYKNNAPLLTIPNARATSLFITKTLK